MTAALAQAAGYVRDGYPLVDAAERHRVTIPALKAYIAEHLGKQTPADELQSVASTNGEGPGSASVAAAHFLRVADVAPERVTWLWQGYVPLGKLTLLDGDPGDGKSTLTLDIAARVTTGSPMPDGSDGIHGRVILLSAEDGIADTIRPRLDAAGADTAQIAVLDEIVTTDEHGRRERRPVELPLDLDHIERAAHAQGVKLVVVDPLMAFLAGVDSHNDQSVWRALHPMSRLADATGAAVLVVRHLNKGSGKALYRGGGSIGIAGAARAVHLVAPDPDDETRRLLAPAKQNIAVKPATLAYRVAGDELHGCARIQWEGTAGATADDLVQLADPADRTERDEAADWLADYLSDGEGEAWASDIKKAAREAGIAVRTLERVRSKIADVRTSGFPRRSAWTLRSVAPKPNTLSGGATGTSGATDPDLGFYNGQSAADSQSRQSRHPTGTGTAVSEGADL
jgi:RecA-family ATPase